MTTAIAVSVKTAAELLEVSETTIREAIDTRALAAKKVGRVLRIDTAALREWFAGLEDARS